jgi:hypothetical protein
MNDQNGSCSGCTGIWWWATLVVAVIAVPTLGLIVAALLHAEGMMQIAVFMITCWVSTYFGMKLMQHPKMSEKFTLKK